MMVTDMAHACVPVRIHTLAVDTALLERLTEDRREHVRVLAMRALHYAHEAARAKAAARRAPANPEHAQDSAAALGAIAAHCTVVARELLAVANQLRLTTPLSA